MAKRNNPVTVYLSDKEKSKLDQWADTVEKPVSQLCREAILEYTDHDRTERIESEVRELTKKVDRVLSSLEGEHTHTSASKSVPEKVREIATRLYENHNTPIKTEDVEIAIEDIAGGDDRTVGKYKEQLKKRGLLFEHPNSPVWTDEKDEYVQWYESSTVKPDVHEATKEYGMSTTEYAKIADKVEL